MPTLLRGLMTYSKYNIDDLIAFVIDVSTFQRLTLIVSDSSHRGIDILFSIPNHTLYYAIKIDVLFLSIT